MVVSALLLRKGSFLAPRDTNVPMSFVPRHPLGTSSPLALGERREEVHSPPVTPPHLSAWDWGAALGRSHLPAAQKADFSGDSTAATINHSLTLLQRLQELLQNGNGSDSVLRVRSAASDEPKVFHTHQLLLSLQSEVFESLLRNQSVVTLHEPPETAALFEKFIRCVGTPWEGEVRRMQLFWGPWGTPRDGDAQRDAAKEGGCSLGNHRDLVGCTFWEGCSPGGRILPWGPWRSCGMGIPGGIRPRKEDAPLGTMGPE